MLFMLLTGCPPFAFATRNDRSYKLVVYRGRVRTFLEMHGLPMLSDDVRRGSCRKLVFRRNFCRILGCVYVCCVFFLCSIFYGFPRVCFFCFFSTEKPRKSVIQLNLRIGYIQFSKRVLEPLGEVALSQDPALQRRYLIFFALGARVRPTKTIMKLLFLVSIYSYKTCIVAVLNALPVVRRHTTNFQGI